MMIVTTMRMTRWIGSTVGMTTLAIHIGCSSAPATPQNSPSAPSTSDLPPATPIESRPAGSAAPTETPITGLGLRGWPNEGHLARAEIQRVVRENYGGVKECYAKGMKRSPTLAGKLVVQFFIDADGSVVDVAEVEDKGDFPDKETTSCILEAFRKIRFPAPDGGKLSVLYPLILQVKPNEESKKEEAPKE